MVVLLIEITHAMLMLLTFFKMVVLLIEITHFMKAKLLIFLPWVLQIVA